MNIITSEPKVIWNSKAILGEGTLWVPSHNSIYFVDIKRKRILILNIKTNKKRIIKMDKEIGFLAHIKKDIFVLGLQSELRIINLKNKETIRSIPIEEDKPLNRINDGKIDPKGRLWFGTMDNLERNIKNGSLYCLDKKLNIHKVDTKYCITNGPAFINAENFLHTDSRSKTIYKIKINKKYKIIKKTKFLKFSKKDGSPDGMTIDSKKNVWVCHYGGACTFGGLKNNELFVTTALKGLKKSEIENYKYSGSLFNIKTNIKGLYTKQFNI